MKLNYTILIGSVGLGIINKFILNNIEFISSYGNDLLAVPILLSLYSILFNTQIKLKYGIIILIIGSILSEFIRPLFDLNTVVDLWDIVAYLVGMIIYYIIVGVKNEK